MALLHEINNGTERFSVAADGSVQVNSAYTLPTIVTEEPNYVLTAQTDGSTAWAADSIGMEDWIIAGDTGTTTITDGDTMTIAGGTNVTTAESGGTVTINSTDQYVGTVTSITLAADSGTGTAITTSGTFTFTGGTNVTTAVSGTTVTIDADLAGTVTGTGTANTVTKFTAASVIGDGPITFATNDSTFAGDVTMGKLTATKSGTAGVFNSGTTNVVASFTSTDGTGVIQLADNNGNVEIGASGDNFVVQPAGGVAQLTVGASSSTFAGSITANVGTFNSDSGGTGLKIIGRSAANSGTLRYYQNNGTTQTARIESNDSIFEINSISNLPIELKTNDTLALTLDSSQNATFAGDVTIPNGKFLKLVRSSGSLATEAIGITSGTDDVRLLTTGDFNFINGSLTNLLHIENGGNVGIGTDSPGYKLEVVKSGADGINIDVGADFGGIRLTSSTGAWSIRTSIGDDLFFYDVDNSNQAVTFERGGNVGIGQTSPNGKLEVFRPAGQSSNPQLILSTGESGSSDYSLSTDVTAAGDFCIVKGNSNVAANVRLKIDSSANVSIGTDTPLYLYSEQDIAQVAVNRVSSNGTIIDTSRSAAYINLNASNGGSSMTFHTANANNTAPPERMRITSVGNINILNATATDSKSIGITNAAGTTGWTFGNGVLSNTHQFVIYDNTAGSPRMLIDSSGKVGIAKTNPAYTLDVTGSIYCTASYVRASTAPDIWYSNNNTDTYTQTVLYMAQNNTSNNDANGYFLERGRISNSSTAEIRRWVVAARGGQKQMVLDGPGTLTVAGDLVAYGSPSDKRLKENIKPIESALDKVSKLQGVTFNWKESDSILNIKEDIGFIAQDVQKVIPELVRENEDGMLSMRHQGIVPILLEAIKELKAEIEELKSNKCNCNK